ncbi:hypothetical protein MIMGU_mgv1a0106082mg, partial [Erythranthe guttata]
MTVEKRGGDREKEWGKKGQNWNNKHVRGHTNLSPIESKLNHLCPNLPKRTFAKFKPDPRFFNLRYRSRVFLDFNHQFLHSIASISYLYSDSFFFFFFLNPLHNMEGGAAAAAATAAGKDGESSSYTYWVRGASLDAAPLPVPKKIEPADLSNQPNQTHLGSAWNR